MREAIAGFASAVGPAPLPRLESPAMFKRLRQLEISLAAKCQILFGAAVVLIISAALFVPWQRMEQLTEQINERSARTLCDDAIADHFSGIPANVRPTTLPDAGPSTRSTAATTLPAVIS